MVIVGSASRGPTCPLDLVINDDDPTNDHKIIPQHVISRTWNYLDLPSDDLSFSSKGLILCQSNYPIQQNSPVNFRSEFCFVPTQPNPTQPIQRRIYCRPWASPPPVLADEGFYGDQVRNGWMAGSHQGGR